MASRRRSALRKLHKEFTAVRDTLRRKFHRSGVTREREKLLKDFHKLARANKVLGLPLIDNFEPGDAGKLASARPPAGKRKAGKKR
jgi:hypothetical protein